MGHAQRQADDSEILLQTFQCGTELWRILRHDSEEIEKDEMEGPLQGFLLVYVDEILILAPEVAGGGG